MSASSRSRRSFRARSPATPRRLRPRSGDRRRRRGPRRGSTVRGPRSTRTEHPAVETIAREAGPPLALDPDRQPRRETVTPIRPLPSAKWSSSPWVAPRASCYRSLANRTSAAEQRSRFARVNGGGRRNKGVRYEQHDNHPAAKHRSTAVVCIACAAHTRPADVPWQQHSIGCTIRARALADLQALGPRAVASA